MDGWTFQHLCYCAEMSMCWNVPVPKCSCAENSSCRKCLVPKSPHVETFPCWNVHLPERSQCRTVHMPKCSHDETSVPKWLLPECSVPKWSIGGEAPPCLPTSDTPGLGLGQQCIKGRRIIWRKSGNDSSSKFTLHSLVFLNCKLILPFNHMVG